MTQTKFVKIARATVVLAVQLAWILVKLVLLAAAAVLRAVTSGPGSSEGQEGHAPVDRGMQPGTAAYYENWHSKD